MKILSPDSGMPMCRHCRRDADAHAALLAACESLIAVRLPHITGPIHETGSWQDRLRQAIAHARDAVAEAKGGAD